MPYVEREIKIDASREAVWEITKDMEKYPELMPDVESVKITERGVTGDGKEYQITEWVTSVEGTPILWTEKDIFFPEEFRIDYYLIEGDLDKFEGSWNIRDLGTNRSEAVLGVDYDFGIPELTNLIGPTLHEKVGENSTMMLQGIKQRAEALARTV